ncbi:hypothetical protein HPB48_014737 [Haemaphysalis longicornis]|uniref:Uncharacterized protein n=1 Tax=Haemaphysalis longicornis TaxID=44386 RepID=A0A9J6G781_HAELO|nr:hypothetical protein HPB48_014737 [Haemaphysalis longicornis]
MSADEGRVTRTATSSRIVSALEETERAAENEMHDEMARHDSAVARYLDALIEGKRAELHQAQREAVASAEANDVGPEARQASWQALQEEGETVGRVLGLLVQKQQQLKDQIERLLSKN